MNRKTTETIGRDSEVVQKPHKSSAVTEMGDRFVGGCWRAHTASAGRRINDATDSDEWRRLRVAAGAEFAKRSCMTVDANSSDVSYQKLGVD